MKQRNLGTGLLTGTVALAVLVYFGLQIYRYFTDPLTSAVAYDYQVEESVTVNGWVVRDELVLEDPGSELLRLSRTEGERVSAGGQVAVAYADQASLDRQRELDSLTDRLSQLQYAQEAADRGEAALKLDSQITDAILTLNGALAENRLERAGAALSSLRSLVLKRDYTYSDTEDLSAQIAELEAQRKALQSQSSVSRRVFYAPCSGLYSSVVDGYESALTPETLEALTPSALSNVQPSGGASALGKILRGNAWYYAVSLSAADAAGLSVGDAVTLRFAKGAERDFQMTADSLSSAENGRVAAVLSSDRYLSEVTLLRQQSADLITDAVSGLRVPSNALRGERITVDSDGKRTSSAQTGVYCIVGAQARFKPVTVVYTGDGFVLVKAASDADKTLLRSGDEIIINARDLFDGKVVA